MARRLWYARLSYAFKRFIAILNSMFFCLVLQFFRSLNHKVRSKLLGWYMRKETSEHFRLLTKVFKWMILPASIFYVSTNAVFFRENTLGSMLWAVAVFFYSQFLPDLPSVFRRKRKGSDDLAWYKKYAILLLAPVLIWLLYSGIKPSWKTTENFHNFKSVFVYTLFLAFIGFLAFGDFQLSIPDATEILAVPLYGLIGYLTHLKVDKIW